MADNSVFVAGTVTVDTSGANKNVTDLNKSLGTTKQSLVDVNKTAADTSKTVQESGGNFLKLKESISSVPGPLKDASEGVGKLSDAFKAMLANPVVLVITAIVAALAFLYKAFTNTFEGGEKMEQVFAGIKAAAGAVLDAIFDLGGAIIKFFSGDFKGAFDDAKKAIDGVVVAATDAYDQVSKLTAQAQKLARAQADNDLEQAQRQAKLADLRAKAYDADTSTADRIAALKELKTASEQNAKDDLALAKAVADNKIALLSVGKDAAQKNYIAIKEIQADQVKDATQNSNELKQIGKQITTAEKQEQAERLSNAKAAAEAAKKQREELEAYNTQLNKINQANALAGITDQYAKETQVLENHIQDEQNLIKKEFEDGKITRAQFNALTLAENESAAIQRKALVDKHNQDIADNEVKFQKQLADIRSKTSVDGIVNQREKESVQLEISHQQELAQAEIDYKNDADKLFQIKQAIDAEYAAKQAALDEKNRIADEKKALADSKKHANTIINDPKAAYAAKQAAIDAEQAQVQKSFDDKALTESEYNDEVEQLSQAREKVRQQELASISMATNSTADLLDTVSDALGKNTAAGKALAIAAATIKALQAEVTIIAGLSEVGPFGFIAGIAAAAAVGVGLFNTIRQIEAVEVPGQSGSGSSTPSSPISIPTAPISPTQQSTSLDQSSINAVGSAVSGRAYVLDADVANQRDRDARLTRAARLGG